MTTNKDLPNTALDILADMLLDAIIDQHAPLHPILNGDDIIKEALQALTTSLIVRFENKKYNATHLTDRQKGYNQAKDEDIELVKEYFGVGGASETTVTSPDFYKVHPSGKAATPKRGSKGKNK